MSSFELRDQPLSELLRYVCARLEAGEHIVTLRTIDPARSPGHYAGELCLHDGRLHRHHTLRTWVDLAERLELRLHTPRPVGDGWLEISFERLEERGAIAARPEDVREKYGRDSEFQRIDKTEDPGFVLDMADALERVRLPEHPRILDLGVNRGDELALLLALRPELATAAFVGVDHSASALALARERFPADNFRFLEADINALDRLELGTFDLVLSIGTLHSPGIDDRAVLRRLFKHHLEPRAGMIFGFPNCTYRDGELRYGAKMKNFRQPELSLLIKQVGFYKKYLQQHRRKVFVTGKHYLLVTGAAE